MTDSSEEAGAASPLLATKLYVPKSRSDLVRRGRLIERLNQGMERKLALVSAPAGFGKTTLLAEWLTANPAKVRSVAWVSLERNDNDPTLFWSYFITALQMVEPGVGGHALSLLRSPQHAAIELVLTSLINEINSVDKVFVLVFDDLHVIDAQPIHDGMTFLVEHLPPRLHLVIASRSDPPLPLARLRARGELVELRAADLRFTSDEAAAFLNKAMGLKLTAGDVAALEARTEGWIAGLQLAALSMQGRKDATAFIRAFAGDDRYIVDYLVEEVLERQPERVQRFLLETSILDRLSGPLCDAVTGGDDGKILLRFLERSNLFVVPLDDKRQWFRFHHLFADVLRRHVREHQPDRLPALHQRSAAWFAEHGMAVEAIEQAQAAGDHEMVARLLSANLEELESAGRYASIARWSSSLPEEMVRKRPRLALIHATSALVSENNNETARRLTTWAEDAIHAIENGEGSDRPDDVDGTFVGPEGLDVLKGEVLALKLSHSARKLPPEEVAELAGRALELLPPNKHRVRATLRLIGAGIQMSLSDMKSALPAIERSVGEARLAQNPPLLAGVLTHHGQAYAAMGALEDARRSYEEALSIAQNAAIEAYWVVCAPHTGLAEVLLERGNLPGANHHASKALEFALDSPTRSHILFARTTAARVLLAAGHTKSALEQLEEAQKFVRGSSDSRYVPFLSSVQLDIYCRTGDLGAAASVVRDRGLTPDSAADYNNEQEMVAYACYLMAKGAYGDAARVLARVVPMARSGGRVQHEIQALVLQALTHEQSGDRVLALESLGRATLLGELGRFNRTFTGDRPEVARLLAALASAVRRTRGPAEAGSLPYLTFLLHETGNGPEAAHAPATAAGLAEPFTTREREILRLVAAGMRNQEIADHLFVSLATVKRHIANAYGKLGATHRTEAIVRANERHLL